MESSAFRVTFAGETTFAARKNGVKVPKMAGTCGGKGVQGCRKRRCSALNRAQMPEFGSMALSESNTKSAVPWKIDDRKEPGQPKRSAR
jgi:hypothetical protein